MSLTRTRCSDGSRQLRQFQYRHAKGADYRQRIGNFILSLDPDYSRARSDRRWRFMSQPDNTVSQPEEAARGQHAGAESRRGFQPRRRRRRRRQGAASGSVAARDRLRARDASVAGIGAHSVRRIRHDARSEGRAFPRSRVSRATGLQTRRAELGRARAQHSRMGRRGRFRQRSIASGRTSCSAC